MYVISDLSVFSHERILQNNEFIEKIVFSFSVPFIPNPFSIDENYVAGFQLYRNNEVVKSFRFTEATSTGYIEYTFNDLPGDILNFAIQVVDKQTNFYPVSSSIQVQTFCTPISSLSAGYVTGPKYYLKWVGTLNPLLTHYIVKHTTMDEYKLGEQNSIISTIVTEENQLTITFNEAVTGLVRVVYRNWAWKKTVFEQTSVEFRSTDLDEFCDQDIDYEQISLNNLLVYHGNIFVEDFAVASSTGVVTTTGIEFEGTWEISEISMEERVTFVVIPSSGSDVNIYPRVYTDIFVHDAVPDILPWGRQTDETLNNEYWRSTKKVLVDSPFYKKGPYAIPFKTAGYEIDGWLNTGKEVVEVFVNGRKTQTIESNVFGYFKFTFKCLEGKNTIRLSTAVLGKPVLTNLYEEVYCQNIYTHFVVLGTEAKNLEDSIDEVYFDYFVDTVTEQNIEKNFGSQIGIRYSKTIDGTYDYYRRLLKVLLGAHLDFGLRESIFDIVDIFSNFYDEGNIYERDEQYVPLIPDYSHIANATNLYRGDYYYGVSSVNSEGGESAISTLHLDKRWWAFFFSNGIGLQWDKNDAVKYNIYRGTSYNTMQYLISTSSGLTSFVDTGNITPDPNNVPLEFDFLDIKGPENLRELPVHVMINNFDYLKRKTVITVILTSSLDPFPELIINRIYKYGTLAVNPLKLRLIVAGDKYIAVKENEDDITFYMETEPDYLAAYTVKINPEDWIPDSSYYVYEINHNLESDDVFPRARVNGEFVIPGFVRINSNTLKIFWNNDLDTMFVDLIKWK